MGKKLEGEACVQYETDGGDGCYEVYAQDKRRNIWADPPEGSDDLPEDVDVEYRGKEYDAEPCTLAYGNEALCWTVG